MTTINRIRKNFQSYKGRKEPQANQLVKVYKNLHNGLWSIKDAKTGLVLGHTSELSLHVCMFIVSESGRQRVLKEKKENIHAYVIGYYHCDKAVFTDGVVITYNPHKDSHFTTLESNRGAYVRIADQTSMVAENSKIYGKMYG